MVPKHLTMSTEKNDELRNMNIKKSSEKNRMSIMETIKTKRRNI